ncbi:EcsC family protein [Aneurinibacillus thermoaerophilus]|uniref:EcsC family protein n=1 Tax=Aneurinibacillus thermoaerophilus TaxID=143495 RepID=UPI002E1EE2B0|nr:EcsC family protein [Aneurinibacillus thermoaerophilus]MED0759596.1 EcsC family protein [Aneurinibacillus thermoaerophilus]
MVLNKVETKEYLMQELKRVETWENEQKDLWFWEKLGRLPFVLLDKITPKLIRDKIGQAIDEVGSYIQTGGQYLISEKQTLERLQTFASQDFDALLTISGVAHYPLEVMDKAAEEIGKSRTNMAIVQGATTGIGGLFTLAIDIPALLGLSLKVLQEIAICYGYDPKEKQERIFIIKCMQFVSSDIVGKKAIIEELGAFGQEGKDREVIAQLQGWQETAMNYIDNFGWKKLFQLIPIIGVVFGAYINKSTVEEVAEAGRMLYRKRRIIEKLKQVTENSVL